MMRGGDDDMGHIHGGKILGAARRDDDEIWAVWNVEFVLNSNGNGLRA